MKKAKSNNGTAPIKSRIAAIPKLGASSGKKERAVPEVPKRIDAPTTPNVGSMPSGDLRRFTHFTWYSAQHDTTTSLS